VKAFEPTRWIEHKRARQMDRFAQMAVAAAREAEADAGLEIGREADRVGASIASAMGGLNAFENCYDRLVERGPDRVSPFSATASAPPVRWKQSSARSPSTSECCRRQSTTKSKTDRTGSLGCASEQDG
jgi:3-oxoacyl-[acyl-carrier-protein] synthase II